MIITLLLQFWMLETLGAPVFNKGALQAVAQEALSHTGSYPSLGAMAHNLADSGAIAGGVRGGRGQVKTGYPILRNSIGSFSGFDYRPYSDTVPVERQDSNFGLTTANTPDSPTQEELDELSQWIHTAYGHPPELPASKQLNPLASNRHPEDSNSGLSEGMPLISETLGAPVLNPGAVQVVAQEALSYAFYIHHTYKIQVSLTDVEYKRRVGSSPSLDAMAQNLVDPHAIAKGVMSHGQVTTSMAGVDIDHQQLVTHKVKGFSNKNQKYYQNSKLDAEAMGLRYTDVRLVPKKLAGILVKANLPPNAPKMIMNGEVPEEMANLWKEKALQALRSMNEYYQNVGNRKMTRALREAKNNARIVALGLSTREVNSVTTIPQFFKEMGIQDATWDAMAAQKLSAELVESWKKRAREILNAKKA